MILVKLLIQILKQYNRILSKAKGRDLPTDFFKITMCFKFEFFDTFQEQIDFAMESQKKGKQKTKEKRKRIKEDKKIKFQSFDVDKLKSHLKKELKLAEATESKNLSNKL